MATRTKTRDETNSRDDEREILRHIARLGLSGVAEYQEWCARRGFHRRLQKSRHEMLREELHVARETADLRLAQARYESRNPQKLIESIVHGELTERDVEQPHLKEICAAVAAAAKQCRPSGPLLALLAHAGRHSDLVSSQRVRSDLGRGAGNTFVTGLLNFVRHAEEWIRPVEGWRPRSHNAYRQFAELARHLFARWPIPAFMDSVWFEADSKEARRHQRWFLHLGRGENIREASLPILYTKKMAHHFMQAPADLGVVAAVRWGQILGLGGDARIARGILETRLRSYIGNEDFWTTVLRFFIDNPMLDTAQFGPIVDYLCHERFERQEVFVAPGRIEQAGPRQPNLTMKGRTVESLLRQVEAWHRELGRVRQVEGDWPASGIPEFEFVEGSVEGGNRRRWTIRELLSSKALAAEGRRMRHCVASYAGSCLRRRTSIWTLEQEGFEGHQKVLTVEVNLASRMICQARGKRNALPSEKERNILRRWAERAGLGMARCT
jgi:hypothetical protein